MPTKKPPRAAAEPAAVQNTAPGITWPAATLLYFALAFLFFFPALLPGEHLFGTDYFAGGYFFYDFVSSRLAEGDLPKWVPYIFGGLPLFANPGSAFQPIHLLMSLVLPTSKVLAAVLVVHFTLAGLGMYLLARELGCRSWIAFVAGISYQFTGLIVSWVYAGHDGRMIVATLAPLFFFCLRRGIRTAAIGAFAGAAATLGLALLSFQIQNSYYLLLGAAIWAVYSMIHLGITKSAGLTARVVALGVGAVALGFLLAAVNFLPFVGYIDESPRGQEGGRGYEYSTSFSMPPGEIVSVAVPEVHGVSIGDPATGEPLFPEYTGENGFKLHTEYLGAFALLLLALGGYYARRDRDWWFFAGLSAFMLTIALGGNTPLYRLYYAVLPGTQQFRAPSLAFFMVALSIAAMAAITLEKVARLRDATSDRRTADEAQSELSRLPLIAGAVVGISFLGMIGAGAAGGGWGRLLVFVVLTAGALWMWVRRMAGTVVVAASLVLISVADLWIIGKRFFHTLEPPEVTFARDDVIAFLQTQPQPNRIWTFPLVQQYGGGGAYGGDYPMLYGIQQVGGEHPNPLRSWVEYVGAGTETYIDWHNVIQDPAAVETPEGQAVTFRSEEGFLDAANVRYLVSMVPLAVEGLVEVHRGSALIYENLNALPRAYLVQEVVEVEPERGLAAMTAGGWDPAQVAYVADSEGLPPLTGPLQGTAHITTYSPDRVVVEVQANRPALLVLADNYYEGWKAFVDGQEEPVRLANHTMRAVVVPAGTSEVVFEFDPPGLWTGLYLSFAAAVALIGLAAWHLLSARRRTAPREGPPA